MITILQLLPTGVLLLLAIVGLLYIKRRDEKLDNTITKAEMVDYFAPKHEETERAIRLITASVECAVPRILCSKEHERVDEKLEEICARLNDGNKALSDLTIGMALVHQALKIKTD